LAGKERDSVRMARQPTPMPIIGRGQPVDVYMGAGWSKGVVENSTRESCSVQLKRENKSTVVRDARNIRRSSS
jgi:hypothetical protein